MGREFRIQAKLAPVFPHVPEMVAYCNDGSVIGSEFYVMERVDGIIPRPSELGVDLDARAGPAAGVHVGGHPSGSAPGGPGGGWALLISASGEGYVERQVSGWSDRYRKAKTWNVPSFEKVMAWLGSQSAG